MPDLLLLARAWLWLSLSLRLVWFVVLVVCLLGLVFGGGVAIEWRSAGG